MQAVADDAAWNAYQQVVAVLHLAVGDPQALHLLLKVGDMALIVVNLALDLHAQLEHRLRTQAVAVSPRQDMRMHAARIFRHNRTLRRLFSP